MKRSLCIAVFLLFGAIAALPAQTPENKGVFHLELKADKILPFTVDLPFQKYDEPNDSEVFGDGTTSATVAGWNADKFTLTLQIKGRPYRLELGFTDPAVRAVDSDDFYTITFLKDLQVPGTTMNVPTAYMLLKGSFIRAPNN